LKELSIMTATGPQIRKVLAARYGEDMVTSANVQAVQDGLRDLELDDPDDPMTATDIPCTICGTEIDADGNCANGHDDLDRADAGHAEDGDVELTDFSRPATGQADAESVADVARALGADDAQVARLVRAAGLCPDCGDLAHDRPCE
jgi:hypothetical protein